MCPLFALAANGADEQGIGAFVSSRDHVPGPPHIGSYTVLASAVCGAETIAVEPDTATMSSLKRNIEMNGTADHVSTIEATFGAQAGTARFAVGFDTRKSYGDGRGHKHASCESMRSMTSSMIAIPYDKQITVRSRSSRNAMSGNSCNRNSVRKRQA
jgi:FkbM family methyltransferase